MLKSIHAAALASAVLLALAAGPAAAASMQYVPTWQQVAQAHAAPPALHYEWRYHYAGHHPEYRGYWALVR